MLTFPDLMRLAKAKTVHRILRVTGFQSFDIHVVKVKNVGAKLLLLVTIAVAVLVMAPGRGRKDASTSSSLLLPTAREQKMEVREDDAKKPRRQVEQKHSERAAGVSMEDRRFNIVAVFAAF